jgi:alkylation response protein AidB-like acyl-CoA dehydrogenase
LGPAGGRVAVAKLVQQFRIKHAFNSTSGGGETMDFALSEEQSAIFDMARDFGQAQIAPHAREWEAAGTIPKTLWPEVGALGFGGLYVSEESGGAGLSRLEATLVFEALSMACPSVAAFLSIHNMCARMLDNFGSDELKARYMPQVLSMETVLSYCLTEPGSGSDAAALKTRAARTNEGYVLNGTKAFISGGGYSDAYVVMVRTGEDGPKGVSTVIVEDGAKGLSFGGLEDKMGWRSQPTRQVQFDDCLVPADNLVGEEGKGFTYAMKGLDGGRLNIAACSLGAAQQALDMTLAYMGERKAFGKSIDQFQALQFRLADMEIELQAARTFLRQAAWKLDTDAPDATKFCAMAKKFVTEAGSRIVNQCLQLHGGYGYLADYGIEKLVRDLRVHEILEGTNEIMRLIVSRQMLADR